MFEYSFSTVYMAVIASNILLILITLLFRNTKIMVNAGYKLLALFIGLTVLRFLLPFELPFTVSVFLKEYEFISLIITYIRHPLYTLSGYEITAWSIFQTIWLIGFLVNLIRYIREHVKARYFVLANSLDATAKEPYCSLLNRICQERNKQNPFRILTVTGIDKPMLYGVFSPCILIPENMELSPDDLYYSIVHEASHHFHHDLLIKKLIKFISMVYWWNPVCYILIRKVDIILEMRVDNVITSSGKETVLKYLRSLLKIGEQAAEESALSKTVTMSLLSEEAGELTQRYYMLVSAGEKKNRVLNVALIALMISIYIASHLFIFEAYYAIPDVVEETTGQTKDNTYAVLKDDGTYDIYYNGYLIETSDSLEYFSSDIPIYTEKEIANEKQ